MDEGQDRIAALERRVTELEARLALTETVSQRAFGEALVAGQLAPTAFAFLKIAGLIDERAFYEALDQLVLRLEEGTGSFPASKEALAHARSRLGVTLRQFGAPPPKES